VKLFLIILLFPLVVSAQHDVEQKSIHQMEYDLHRNDSVDRTAQLAPVTPILSKSGGKATLSKKVYGWHPYWASSTAYLSYDYNALSHIAYFGYETDSATGGYTTIRDWNTTPVIAYAHQRGVKVTLTVVSFGYDANDKLLSDTIRQQRMINTLISLLKSRNGDGVNFDIESLRNTQRANLVAFMRRATTQIKSQVPGAEISMATPAVDWSGTWDFSQLAQICDYLIVMGYDYYWTGSTTAGPVAPLEGENYNITRTVDTYISNGVPREKLLLGVPWYGLDWPVQGPARKSGATGTASSRTYVVAEQMAGSYGKSFDQATKVPWFSYTSGLPWRQVWYDDSQSLGLKYDLVNSRSLGGIGIWALSYEGGKAEIWSGIRSAFATTGVETATSQNPNRYQLLQNYPNPFNPTTNIEFQVANRGFVNLKVFDALGREVATIVNEQKEPGSYVVRWDASAVPSGVYFCVMSAPGVVQTRSMVVLR
jgi:spore germination protein YaaH